MLTTPTRPSSASKTGITIGNFDGVHRGHQLLVSRTLEICAQRQLDSVAITFWPHPRALFSGKKMPPLASRKTRSELLKGLGIKTVLDLNFTLEMASQEPEDFVKSCLLPLSIDSLVIGYDFCLGKGRSGDFATLSRLGEKYGFSVTKVEPLMLGDAPISSTRLRRAVENGEMDLARSMLGRPYSLKGPVVHGEGRGTDMGYPTANLLPEEALLPPDGVYAARVLCRGKSYAAVSNIGFCPTFKGTQRTIESFLLDCSLNLYGEDIELLFLDRIRGEKKFPSVQDLTAQIALDVKKASELNAAYSLSLSNS